MTDAIDCSRLARYCAGDSTPEERLVVESWAAEHPEHRQILAEAQEVWARWGALRPSGPDHVRAWGVLDARILSGAARPTSSVLPLADSHAGRGRAVRARWAPVLGSAIAAAVICGLVVARHITRTGTGHEYVTGIGGYEQVRLPDGTSVVLGPETRLRVPSEFADGHRAVVLDGEGYFAVVHNTRHPFAVLTNNITITDVGTEFDVQTYDDEVRVAVARGSVVVGAGLRPARSSPTRNLPSFQDIPLAAGDMVTVTGANILVTHDAHVAVATAWIQGTLAFDNTPLQEVVRTLGRTYGVDVTLADTALAARTVTASFKRDDTVSDVLDVIAHAVGARVSWDGRRAVLKRSSVVEGQSPPPLTTAQSVRGAE